MIRKIIVEIMMENSETLLVGHHCHQHNLGLDKFAEPLPRKTVYLNHYIGLKAHYFVPNLTNSMGWVGRFTSLGIAQIISHTTPRFYFSFFVAEIIPAFVYFY